MPLNESSRKVRARWPLAFDLEGVPQDTQERTRLLNLLRRENSPETFEEEEFDMRPVNQFAVDAPQIGTVSDVNDPKTPRYGTKQNPYREYPKMMYDHESGRVLEVKDSAQEAATVRRGFQTQPSPHHDYHKVKSGMLAPSKQKGPEREHLLTIEEIEALEQEQLESLTSEAEQISTEEDAEKEIAAALGETGDAGSRRRKK